MNRRDFFSRCLAVAAAMLVPAAKAAGLQPRVYGYINYPNRHTPQEFCKKFYGDSVQLTERQQRTINEVVTRNTYTRQTNVRYGTQYDGV